MKIEPIFLALILNFIPVNMVLAQGQSNDQYEEDSSLISPETNVNYNSLAELLKEKKWRKANDETRNLLLQATGTEARGWTTTEEIKKLSCWDLKTIDNLWKESSQGKFGFSVQLPIYIATGNRPGKLVGDDAYIKFGDQVGWRENNDWIIFIENLNYSLDAPAGHLPNPRPEYSITGGRLGYTTLAGRMVQCKMGDNMTTNN